MAVFKTQDYVECELDLNELCIRNPYATFFVRVEGDSMIGAGIYDGDVLVVDRSVDASMEISWWPRLETNLP